MPSAGRKTPSPTRPAAIITAFHPVWERPNLGGAIAGLAVEASKYMDNYGVTEKDGARVAVRERLHALNNPYAHLHQEWMKTMDVDKIVDLLVTTEQNQMLAYPLRMSDMCPRTDGAAAVVFASEDIAGKIAPKPAWVAATANRHDFVYLGDLDWDFNTPLMNASKKVFDKAGIKEPLKQIDLCELYLPYSYGGLKWMENMGFCQARRGPEARLGQGNRHGRRAPGQSFRRRHELQSHRGHGPSSGWARPPGRSCASPDHDRYKRTLTYALTTGFGGCSWADVMLLSSKKPS